MCFCSYIVPVYNVFPEYLQQCLDSILCEKDIPIEVILVDDASSNGCEKICDEYKADDSRVRVLHLSQNQGVSNARNLGIQLSNGEWIVFVDSDDWVESNITKRLMEEAIPEADIIVYSAYRDSIDRAVPLGTAPQNITYAKEQGNYTINELCGFLLKQKLLSTPGMCDTLKYCWGKAFKRAFLVSNDIVFPNLDYCEDIVFVLEACQKSQKVIQIPDRLYHYRTSLNSVVNSYRENIVAEQQQFLKVLYEKSGTDESYYYAVLLSMEICIARYFFNKNNKKCLLKKHFDARHCFSELPYREVFCHIDITGMKRKEKLKAYLLCWKLYYVYYAGTQARIKKTTGFQ